MALSPEHRELRQEAEKYRALAFWLDGCDDDNADTNANKSEGADDAPPAFSSPPLLPLSTKNGGGTVLLDREEDDELGSSASVSSSGHHDPRCSAALAAAQQTTDNLDVDFMAGDGEWVCGTRVPPLSPAECAAVVAEAEEKAAAAAAASGGGGGSSSSGWGTARHYAVPTTDVAVRELPRTLAWFNGAMRTRIGPLVAAAASLGDGVFTQQRRRRRRRRRRGPASELEDAVTDAADTDSDDDDDDVSVNNSSSDDGSGPSAAHFLRRLRVHDAFVVRYDAAAQRSLPLHTDQGELSLTISLNGADEYEGGGTWFEGLGRAVRPEEAGHVVVFPGGSTVHGGREVTSGVRYILAVFLYMHREEEEEEEEGGGGWDQESEDE